MIPPWRAKGWLLALAPILLSATALRYAGAGWDSYHLLHPDERFLLKVASATRVPAGIGEYFDDARSQLNPRNIGFKYFAYGTLPLEILKMAAHLAGFSGLAGLACVGRFRWLRDNDRGTPVIAEFNTYPGSYTWGNRVSIYTGLPAIVVRKIFQPGDRREAWNLLRKYGARYLVWDSLENACAGEAAPNLSKDKELTGMSCMIGRKRESIGFEKALKAPVHKAQAILHDGNSTGYHYDSQSYRRAYLFQTG